MAPRATQRQRFCNARAMISGLIYLVVESCSILCIVTQFLACRLTGVSPFAASNIDDIIRNNEKCEIEFPTELWGDLSEEAEDLVNLMTQPDPDKRATLDACLKHSWLTKNSKPPSLENVCRHIPMYHPV